MALILNIETSTKNCSVAIARDGVNIAVKEEIDKNYCHGEKLHVFIKHILDKEKINISSLDAIAVGKGPGSYTGLRIGSTAAKGLAYTIEKPLIAIDSLKILAKGFSISDGWIIPMIDARRSEVYSAIYDQNCCQIREIMAEIIEGNSFQSLLKKGKIYFIGDANEKCKTYIRHDNAIFIENTYPSAADMASLSEEKHKLKLFENTAYFEPFYLKNFIPIPQKSI